MDWNGKILTTPCKGDKNKIETVNTILPQSCKIMHMPWKKIITIFHIQGDYKIYCPHKDTTESKRGLHSNRLGKEA